MGGGGLWGWVCSFPAERACLAPAFRHKIFGKGKGRHFFSKIEPGTSIFFDFFLGAVGLKISPKMKGWMSNTVGLEN